MSTTYQQLTEYDLPHGIMKEVREKWHQRLDDAKVTIGILFAKNEDGAPIKAGKYKAIASIQVMSLKFRAAGMPDALMLIDADEWADLSEESREALIDHELCHIDIVEKDSPEGGTKIQRDDLGRPKLRTIPGDWNGGDGFRAVIERHGDDAIEFINSRRVFTAAKAAKEEAEVGSP